MKRTMDTTVDTEHSLIQQPEQLEIVRTQADLYYLQMLALCDDLGMSLQSHWTPEIILSHIDQNLEVNRVIYQSLHQGFQYYQRIRYSATLLWEDFKLLEKQCQDLHILVKENLSSKA